jgi:hypothetical protein
VTGVVRPVSFGTAYAISYVSRPCRVLGMTRQKP